MISLVRCVTNALGYRIHSLTMCSQTSLYFSCIMNAPSVLERKTASKLKLQEPRGRRCDAHGECCVLRLLLAPSSLFFAHKLNSVINAAPETYREDKEKNCTNYERKCGTSFISQDLAVKLFFFINDFYLSISWSLLQNGIFNHFKQSNIILRTTLQPHCFRSKYSIFDSIIFDQS